MEGRPRARAVLGLLLGLAACSGGRDGGKTPEGAVRALITAARAGDRAAVFRQLGPATRQQITELEQQASRQSGRVPLRPEDFLSVGWAPPSWEPSAIRVLRRGDTTADVEVSSQAGDRDSVPLVREGSAWKIELPTR